MAENPKHHDNGDIVAQLEEAGWAVEGSRHDAQGYLEYTFRTPNGLHTTLHGKSLPILKQQGWFGKDVFYSTLN